MIKKLAKLLSTVNGKNNGGFPPATDTIEAWLESEEHPVKAAQDQLNHWTNHGWVR